MKPRTLVTRAGLPPAKNGQPFLAGPTFAAPFHLTGDPADTEFTYGRFHNPTWSAYEAALAALEGGPALVFASGMAAIAAVFGAILRAGDIVVLPSDSYYTNRALAMGYFAQMGVIVQTAPTANDAQAELLNAGPPVKLLWLETPSNPLLEVCDITRLTELAHARGTLVAVDNTTVTPLSQQPLALGADFAVVSDTKAMSGHHDVLLGHVAVRDPAWLEPIRAWRTQVGAIAGPMETWLAHRSLATLAVRLECACENAQQIALRLAAHPKVREVRYPGLATHPAHALASRQMAYHGPILSFTLADQSSATRFLGACELVTEATSFGGIHTTAERRARWGGDPLPAGFVRMSVGIEDSDDLIADIVQALAQI